MEKLEIGKYYKIGKYDKCRIGGNYFLCSDDIENNNIYTQFGITKEDIYKILGYTSFGIFPTCKSLEDLQKVYEYMMSKDPNNKKTINVEDLKYPHVIHITNQEQWNTLSRSKNLTKYTPEKSYYLVGGGYQNKPYIGNSVGKGSYINYEFEDIIFPEEKQKDKFIVGKWYNITAFSSDVKYIIKYKNKRFSDIEYICHEKYEGSGCFNNVKLISEVSIEEIQKWLPDGHPDKQIVKKSLVFKKGIWYKYHSARFYMHCSKDAIDTLFYDKYIEVSTGHVGEDTSSYSNKYITNEEVPLSEIEKYIPNKEKEVISSGAIHRNNLIKDEFYVGNWSPNGKVIFQFSGDLKECNHLIQTNGKYNYGSCCTARDIIFRQATKKEKELLISKIPKETMKEQINFIHGEYYVDRVNSGGSRIFKYDKPNYQLYYINTAVKCFFINNYDSSLEKDSVPATQKEIDWLNKCIKANRFVSENYFVELTSLPEKWCVKPRTSKEADEIFTYKGISEYSDSKSLEYYQHYPSFNSCCTASSTIQDGYTEITYEQFKKWVMKEEEFKIGNWVVITQDTVDEGRIGKILSKHNCHYWNVEGMNHRYMQNQMRKALPHEIPNTASIPSSSDIEENFPKEQIKEHYNETINSSTNVEYSTKGALPLYNVKKRLVLN